MKINMADRLARGIARVLNRLEQGDELTRLDRLAREADELVFKLRDSGSRAERERAWTLRRHAQALERSGGAQAELARLIRDKLGEAIGLALEREHAPTGIVTVAGYPRTKHEDPLIKAMVDRLSWRAERYTQEEILAAVQVIADAMEVTRLRPLGPYAAPLTSYINRRAADDALAYLTGEQF